MTEVHTAVRLVAPAGDDDAFRDLTGPFHRELLIHCYRILGSLEDAEDALQEALLRAWRRLDSLRERASLRAWLYKTATHVCLDMLKSRKRRAMPSAAHARTDPHDSLPAPVTEPIWLDPLPETYLAGYLGNPEADYELHESLTLAFLTALQTLPGRQRAVLILRDVLGWSARDVAELLDASVAAVNSALQRARATMKAHQQRAADHTDTVVGTEQTATLLSRYVAAWEADDSAGLITLLREDAVLTMPPLPAWYRGHAAIKRFLDTYLFTEARAGQFRLVATHANGCPAFAVYQRDEAGTYRISALHILTIEADQIVQIDDFLALDERRFSRFNLPPPIDR